MDDDDAAEQLLLSRGAQGYWGWQWRRRSRIRGSYPKPSRTSSLHHHRVSPVEKLIVLPAVIFCASLVWHTASCKRFDYEFTAHSSPMHAMENEGGQPRPAHENRCRNGGVCVYWWMRASTFHKHSMCFRAGLAACETVASTRPGTTRREVGSQLSASCNTTLYRYEAARNLPRFLSVTKYGIPFLVAMRLGP